MCRLIGPGAREPGEWRVTRAGAGDSSLVTHARADTGAETGLPECPDPRKLEIKWGQEENFNLFLDERCHILDQIGTEEQVFDFSLSWVYAVAPKYKSYFLTESNEDDFNI